MLRRCPPQDPYRGVAQPGSALAWGASGRWFKSSRPDHLKAPLSLRNPEAAGPSLFPNAASLTTGSPRGDAAGSGGEAGGAKVKARSIAWRSSSSPL